jgi:hypothetical protein
MRRSTAVVALVGIVVSLGLVSLATTGSTVQASVDHVVHLSVDASPVLERQFVPVPGYRTVRVTPAQVHRRTQMLLHQENLKGGPIFSAVSYRDVEIRGHRSARESAGRDLGIVELRLFAEVPALGAGAQVATHTLGAKVRLISSFAYSGVQVYEYVHSVPGLGRYTVMWMQGLTMVVISGGDSSALRAWCHAYLTTTLP